MAILDQQRPAGISYYILLAGDHHGATPPASQILSQSHHVLPHRRGIHSFGGDALPRYAGDLRGVALNYGHGNAVQDLKAFPVPERRRSRSADVQHHRDLLLVGTPAGNYHGLDKIGCEGADIEDQGVSYPGHIRHLFPGMGHDRRAAEDFDDIGAVVNGHPVGEVMNQRRLPSHPLQAF